LLASQQAVIFAEENYAVNVSKCSAFYPGYHWLLCYC